jgi:hypothetical protein
MPRTYVAGRLTEEPTQVNQLNVALKVSPQILDYVVKSWKQKTLDFYHMCIPLGLCKKAFLLLKQNNKIAEPLKPISHAINF